MYYFFFLKTEWIISWINNLSSFLKPGWLVSIIETAFFWNFYQKLVLFSLLYISSIISSIKISQSFRFYSAIPKLRKIKMLDWYVRIIFKDFFVISVFFKNLMSYFPCSKAFSKSFCWSFDNIKFNIKEYVVSDSTILLWYWFCFLKPI